MLRWALRSVITLILLPFFYFAAAGIGALIPGSHRQIDGGVTTRIALARGPIHYDILLPATDRVRNSFDFAAFDGMSIYDPRVQWLVVGWGSRSFYTATGTYADLRLSTVWTALTGDTATLHIDLAGPVESVSGITFITLSETQLAALTDAIRTSLSRDADGRLQRLPVQSFGTTDVFYAAEGHFNALNTCNVWIGAMLRAAGLDFGAWTPTPQSVALSARWFQPAP